jgi:Tfp pilus assembly protein PilN
MPTKLNLASKPFNNRSLPWVITSVLIFVSIVSLVFIFRAVHRANLQAAAAQHDINELKRQENDLRQKVQEVKRSLSNEQLETLEATHVLVDRKQFSWSLLLADLESSLPGDVRVKRIAVKGVAKVRGETIAELEFTVIATNSATITDMIAKMDQAGSFHAELIVQNLQRGRGETGSEYELAVRYRPRNGVPRTSAVEQPAVSLLKDEPRGAGQ